MTVAEELIPRSLSAKREANATVTAALEALLPDR